MLDRTPDTTKWLALLAGLAAAALFLINVTDVIRYEASGVAVYSHGPRGMLKEPVLRQVDPEKFRSVIQGRWAYAVGCLLVSSTAFYFFRRLSS